MSEVWGQAGVMAAAILLLALSAGCQLFLGCFLFRLSEESKSMEEGRVRLLAGWLEQYRKEEKQIVNLSAFVDKGIQELKVGRFSLHRLTHLSGQLLLLAVLLAGIGACRGIASGQTLGDVLPFYLLCFVGLYIHFSLSGIVDAEEKTKAVRIRLLDFLENHKPYLWREAKPDRAAQKPDREEIWFDEAQEKELKELLQEILT